MSLKIDVFSDVICPWCYVGKRRLERALDQLGLRSSASIQWLPFELNPDMPDGGIARSEYRARKFGRERSAQLDLQMRAIGANEGIEFAFDRMTRTPNTRRAHMLVGFATEQGRGDQLVGKLFHAYFEDARDIGDPEVLVDLAAETGIDRQDARMSLESDERRRYTVSIEERAAEMGIQGVPFFVVEGQWAVSGAQTSEQWVRAFQERLGADGALAQPA